MRFYTTEHRYYCGVDLHARNMYLRVLDKSGNVRCHRRVPAQRDAFLGAVRRYRRDLVVAVECLFCWYWLADVCAEEGIDFVLGHALYMKAIHSGKAKNDRIDSHKIATLLRGGSLPMAYSRLVTCSWESDGKRKHSGGGTRKMGNVHLKWAFSEAAALYLRGNPVGKKFYERLQKKHGRGKAMGVLSTKLGRAAYYMLKRNTPFDQERFVKS